MKNEPTLDFSLLLASSVHDIKNSLGMLLTSLDEVIELDEIDNEAQRKNYNILRGEASRINQSLICLLGLYRMEYEQLNLSVSEVFVKDFLDEQIAGQQLLFDINKIHVHLECDDNLTAFFDENLIAGVISNILVNGAKYTHDTITVKAQQLGRGVTISITDNGDGYPEAIINNISNNDRSINFSSGSTNLGLYFAQQITLAHQCKNQCGSIELSNHSNGGGQFTLTLP